MREQILRDFFLGALSARELRADLAAAMVRVSGLVTRHPITDMDEDFHVEPGHLASVCKAVLDGELEAWMLEPIGFALVASDRFWWDSDTAEGARVAQAAYDWSSPETNYVLTRATAARFLHRLLTGESTFAREDFFPAPSGG